MKQFNLSIKDDTCIPAIRKIEGVINLQQVFPYNIDDELRAMYIVMVEDGNIDTFVEQASKFDNLTLEACADRKLINHII